MPTSLQRARAALFASIATVAMLAATIAPAGASGNENPSRATDAAAQAFRASIGSNELDPELRTYAMARQADTRVLVWMGATQSAEWLFTEIETDIWQIQNVRWQGCLTAARAEGEAVTIDACRNSTAQLWRIPQVSWDGSVSFTNMATGRCVTGPSPTGAYVPLRGLPCDNSRIQRFRIVRGSYQ